MSISQRFADFVAENSGDEPLDFEALTQVMDDAEQAGISVPSMEVAEAAYIDEDVEEEDTEEEDTEEEDTEEEDTEEEDDTEEDDTEEDDDGIEIELPKDYSGTIKVTGEKESD